MDTGSDVFPLRSAIRKVLMNKLQLSMRGFEMWKRIINFESYTFYIFDQGYDSECFIYFYLYRYTILYYK